MVTVPLSEQVGKPLLAPVPAAAATPLSAEALLVEVPWELPPPSPDFPRSTNVNDTRESSFFKHTYHFYRQADRREDLSFQRYFESCRLTWTWK